MGGEGGEGRGEGETDGSRFIFYNPAPHTTLCMQPAAPPLGAQGWRSYSTALLVTVFAVIAASVTLLKEGSELHNLCPPPPPSTIERAAGRSSQTRSAAGHHLRSSSTGQRLLSASLAS